MINKKNTYNKIYNLATTENPVTILELAEKIKNLLNNNIQINFIPIGEIYGSSYRDVEFRLPSLAKLKKVVQVWEEKKLEEILTEIINDEKLKLVLNIS